jgi:hypothetical protein
MRSIRFVLAVVLTLAASQARAQEAPSGLAGLLLRFFSPSNPVVLQKFVDPSFSHDAHFLSQPNATSTLSQINRAIASQVSTFPLGSSSAGFTYTFDSSLGVYNRTTQSFGPVFAERPQTSGKGKFSFGVTYQNATYDRLDDHDLRNGDLKLFLTHLDINNSGNTLDPWFKGDFISAALSLDIQSKTTVVFANYGVTPKFDIGVALPFVDVSIDARINANIQRVATGTDGFVPPLHAFPPPSNPDSTTYVETGSASGIGDMVFRAKYNFLSKPSAALAAALDLRVPTGDENNLLGSGGTQAKLYLVAGGTGRLAPRASLGYTISSGGGTATGDLPNELNYTVGFDAAVNRRVTLSGDLLGRTLWNSQKLVEGEKAYLYHAGRFDTAVHQVLEPDFSTQKANLNLLLGSVGIKINPVGRLLLVGNVLFSVGKNGLQDKFTPVFGLDYTF